jgi:ATP-dependent Clp protease ATP-binding subunit ClpB
LDEIEKAHPDVFNTLLQVLDDGRLTDNKGRTVNFKNTIIIMTSNIGSHIIQSNFEGVSEENLIAVQETTRVEVMELLKKTIRPEFLNRIDEIIMFTPLMKNEIREIVKIQIRLLQAKLSGQNVTVDFSNEVIDWIAETGFDPQFGARPVKRLIQSEVVNLLAKEILAGKINKDASILIELKNGKLTFREVKKKLEEV